MKTVVEAKNEHRPDLKTWFRFWGKVRISENGCWLWKPRATAYGYGDFRIGAPRKHWRAHRLAYLWTVGSIPDGLQLDHLCRVRSCVKPSHLEAVTPRVNLLRGNTAAAKNSRKTHCKIGHPFNQQSAANRKRYCRPCAASKMREVRARLAAA